MYLTNQFENRVQDYEQSQIEFAKQTYNRIRFEYIPCMHQIKSSKKRISTYGYLSNQLIYNQGHQDSCGISCFMLNSIETETTSSQNFLITLFVWLVGPRSYKYILQPPVMGCSMDSFIPGRCSYWDFLKVIGYWKFQKIIVTPFEHLQKLYWFWKFEGCSSKTRCATPI